MDSPKYAPIEHNGIGRDSTAAADDAQMPCLFSPCALQVENYALDVVTITSNL